MPFSEIKSVPLADRVEENILQYIHTGQVKPGNPLPSEQEMAEKMNVSRNVVREALSRLRALGLVDSRKKRGLVVKSPKVFNAIKRALHPNVMGENEAAELRDLRIAIELGLAELLFGNITSQDIRDLENIVKHEKAKKQLSHKERVEIDVEFHKKLYESTGNKALMEFQGILMPFFDHVEDLHIQPSKFKYPPDVSHSQLVSILKNGTPEEFRNAMKIHLKPFIDGFDTSKEKENSDSN